MKIQLILIKFAIPRKWTKRYIDGHSANEGDSYSFGISDTISYPDVESANHRSPDDEDLSESVNLHPDQDQNDIVQDEAARINANVLGAEIVSLEMELKGAKNDLADRILDLRSLSAEIIDPQERNI